MVLAPNTTSGEKVLLHLSNLEEDLDGERLDREWANGGAGPDTFPSGDGTGGGAFDFRVNVLPGDANRNGAVNTIDSGEVHARFFSSPTSPGTPPNNYDAFHDINGSGIILADDYGGVTQRYDSTLPASEPAPPAIPTAPSSLVVDADAVTPTLVGLQWTDNSSDETGFLLETSTDGTTFYELATVDAAPGTGTVGYTLNEAFPNMRQYFRVAALNAAGASTFSPVASDVTIPRAPEDLLVDQVQETQIDLSWPVVSGLTGQTLEWAEQGGAWNSVTFDGTPAGAVKSYSRSGLREGTTYQFRLKAANAAGSSPYSETVTVATLPSAPSGLSAQLAQANGTAVNLSWPDTSGGETGYRVEASTAGGDWSPIATAPANATTLSLADLAAATTYTFRVIASNDSGDSQPSTSASATTTGWLLNQEASVEAVAAGQQITLGVAGRAESSTAQLPGVHGAALLLAPRASYTISFTPDLKTWDSYNDSYGYWDSFSVSVGDVPYWQRTDLTQDRLTLPFIWGGNDYGTGTLEAYSSAGTLMISSPDSSKPQYLSVVLDTNTPTDADALYPSWGTFTVSTTPLPVLPVVRVRASRDQAAEGAATAEGNGEFTISREGGDTSQPVTVLFNVTGTATRSGTGTDYSVSFPSGSGTFDPSTGQGTVVVPAGSASAKVLVTAADDGPGAPDADTETVVLTVTEDLNQYKAAATAKTATITILDRKKLFVYFYGFTGPGKFADEWLDKLGDQLGIRAGYRDIGNAVGGRGGFKEDSPSARPLTLGEINRDADKRISAAEAEAVDLRVAGWSYGGTQAVNFVDSLSRAGKPVGGYKLQTAIPVQKLVTWDPVQALFLGPVPIFPHKVRWGRVKDNVKTFRNYWQWHTGFTRFKRQDQVAQPIVVGHPFTNFFHGDVVATDLTGDRVKQYRVDTDPVLSVANEDRDRVNAYSRDPADPDPTVAAGEPDWRIQGRQVNHMSVTWYAYRRSLDDLLA